MAHPPEESRSKRAAREIDRLPALDSEVGLRDIGHQLKGYMAETLVHLIRRLGHDAASERVRRRAEFLLMDARLGHPDALLLQRIVDRLARKLGHDIHTRERFLDAFTDLFRKQVQSDEPQHRLWAENFPLRARSRASDAFQATFRKARRERESEPMVLSLNDEGVPETADHRDIEEARLRSLAGTPVLDAAMEGLTFRQRAVLELWLDGHPQSGDSAPRESIQTLLGIGKKQAIHDFLAKALARIRKTPEVLRLLESRGRPFPSTDQPAGPAESGS